MSPSEHVDITVRPAVESDIADLSDAMAGDVSREQLVNRWREHVAGYRVMLVALLDGNVAGTVSIGGHNHQRPDSLRLFALDVASALRRRGAGSALVCAVEHEAGLRGLGHLNLEVASRKRTSRAALREVWVPAGWAAHRRPLAASHAWSWMGAGGGTGLGDDKGCANPGPMISPTPAPTPQT